MSSDKPPTSSRSSNSSGTGAALSVDDARTSILALVSTTTETESINPVQCVDRISAEDVFARQPVPPFRNSAMDGYAIRYDDLATSKQLGIIGESLAGHPFSGTMAAGTAVTITTGAMIPDDADTIVIMENTTIQDGGLILNQQPKQYQHVRNPGDDISINSKIVRRLQRLTPSDCGLIAAQGISAVKVTCLPRVGIFSTGDELCESTDNPGSGQIYDSNRVSITALLRRCGFVVEDLGIVRDDPSSLQQLLTEHTDFDFILSSGGVSVGQADYVKDVIGENGELVFWKVAMKPGKPMVTAKLNCGALYFGLPGNPVSSLVTCVQFVIPALQAFCGEKYTPPLSVEAICTSELKKEKGRFEFQRGWLNFEDQQLTVATTGLQDSHVLSSLSEANCFICLPQFSTGAVKGETVTVIPFSSLPGL